MAGDPTHKTWFLSSVVNRTPLAMAVAYLLSFYACIFRKSDNKERMKKHLHVLYYFYSGTLQEASKSSSLFDDACVRCMSTQMA
jgi:hypothetical protein